MQAADLRRGEHLYLPRRPTNHRFLDMRLLPHPEVHAALVYAPKPLPPETSCTCSCPFHHSRTCAPMALRCLTLPRVRQFLIFPWRGEAKPGDIHVGMTLVVALLVVALGRHKACPYGVGTVPGAGPEN